ncbi:FapA family protein [Oscillospiraceae bacterium OttesenSCG-928-G22]|nr:FapA family protein [Oscillospiraceae bacterium OttesenSCG-928-G22]
MNVTLLNQNMVANINIAPPQDGGKDADETLVRKALSERGVVFGIDEAKLKEISATPVYNVDIVVAKGVAPINGIDASLRFFFNTASDLRPMEREDGTVDYKELGLIRDVAADQLLCEKTPATKGESGTTVLGKPIAAKPGRDAAVPRGKNTVLSEDGRRLYAAVSGQIENTGRAISVLEVFTVDGDVSNATGNLDFSGSIIVHGSVLTGFEVRAGGSITVNGTCEAAYLHAGTDIAVKEGINGGTLEAGGEIRSKYIQSSQVTAAKSIYSESILNSTTQSGETVNLIGSKGTLVGGSCTAFTSVLAATIGNKNSTLPTFVEVGTDPTTLARKRHVDEGILRLEKSVGDLTRLHDLLEQLKQVGRLDEEKAQKLESVNHTLVLEKERLSEYRVEQEELAEKLSNDGFGYIVGTECIYPGVRITIGALNMEVKTPYPATRITRNDTELLIQPAF